jgi:hypothetical protein
MPSRRTADSRVEQKLHGNRSCILRIYSCIVSLVLCHIEVDGCGGLLFPFRSSRKHTSETWHQRRRGQDLGTRKDQGSRFSELYYERKGRRVSNQGIIHLNRPFSASRCFIPWLNSITGIPETNLRRWRKILQWDPMWRPWQTYAGRHKRIFAKDDEAALTTFMRDSHIATGLLFTDSDFCEIAMNAFLLKHQDSRAQTPIFQCSVEFMANFKGRHCLTSRRIHFRRRSPVTENQRQTWLATIRELLQMCHRTASSTETRRIGFSIQMASAHGRKGWRNQYKQKLQEMKKRTSQSSRL